MTQRRIRLHPERPEPVSPPRTTRGALLIPFAALISFCGSSVAQKPMRPAPADPAVAKAIAKISPEHIHTDIAKLVSFHNRSTISSMDTDLPPGTGVLAAADWIESQFRAISGSCGGCLEVKRDDFIEPPQSGPNARITQPTRIVNVYAILRGADPAQANRHILVTGHYDSRDTNVMDTHGFAPGANDDASGVAVSLECARVLSTSGIRFPATLVFAAVAGEEQGLNGSRHLAKLAKSEGWDLEAVLNNDIVGGDTTPGETCQKKDAVRVFSEGVPETATLDDLRRIRSVGGENDSASRELARTVLEISSTYFREGGKPGATPFHPVLVYRRDRYLRGGDHTSFNLEGFPAVRFTEWRENFNHQHQDVRDADGTLPNGTKGQVQYGDLIQFVDPAYVARVARLNAAAMATLALAPGPPRHVQILTSSLDNNTELLWEPPDGFPAGASYQVVWRATDVPNWTEYTSAGRATSITLPISKDNVVFGVRSLDAAGHQSPAVFPAPTAAASFPSATPAKSEK